MARLAVLEPDARLAARLSTALADYHELIECAEPDGVFTYLIRKGG